MSLITLFDRWTSHFGPLPDSYVVIDLETSGLDPSTDQILQIGYCVVDNSCVVAKGSHYFDWNQVPGRHWIFTQDSVEQLKLKIQKLQKELTAKGRPFHTHWETLCNEGVDPIETLKFFCGWFRELKQSKTNILTHNGYAFDCAFLTTHFQRFLGDGFSFGNDLVIDTGALVKACQIRYYPEQKDTIRSFSTRVTQARFKGVMWALSDFSVPKLELDKKYFLQTVQAHTASYDSFVTHLVFNELKQRYKKAKSNNHARYWS